MATQFRTTLFGQFVRLLSRNKLFKYPDEIGSSPWKRALQRDTNDPRKPPGDETTHSSKGNGLLHAALDHRIPEAGQDIHLVDWYGPGDPENPRNWPRTWKLIIVFQMCILNFAVYIASSIYVPGEADIMQEFGVSVTVATLGLSLFTLGYGFGPMLWSPLSDMPMLGRSRIFIYTLLSFVLLQLPVGFAADMPVFLVFRFLTGFCGSPCLATGGGTIVDIYAPTQAIYAISIWASLGYLGPVFGPIVGGFVAPAKGWRWTIWIFTWMCSIVLIVMFFLLPETSAANILYKRAQRRRKATGNQRLKSQSEIDASNHTAKDHFMLLARAFTLAFSKPIVFLMDLYTGLLYGILFTWFESFPFVFGNIYHFSVGQQGLVFLGILVGGLITVPFFLLWIKHRIAPRLTKPNFKPEMVLPPMFVGCFALPVCLFWYGWSARADMHWIMPVIGSGFFTVGSITLFNSVFNYLGIAYPESAASIFAGNALFRASFGAVFPLFARPLFRRVGIDGGNSLLGGIAVCFIPMPFLFYRYGEKIRHMNRNARYDV